jgi:DNA-binding transcriptional ArsR family regulator
VLEMFSMEKRCDAVEVKDVESLVGLFRLLSDKTRLTILLLLANGERNVSSLCKELDLPQPTVSHHLGLLRMRNLIVNRRDGKQVFYGLNWHVRASADLLNVDIDDLEVSITRHQTE